MHCCFGAAAVLALVAVGSCCAWLLEVPNQASKQVSGLHPCLQGPDAHSLTGRLIMAVLMSAVNQ